MTDDRDKRRRTGRRRVAPDARASENRKERVLHTRISEKLADDIYRVAEDLRVPVSNLVRNVLEDTFSMVESVTDNVGDLIENVLDEAERAREKLSRQVGRIRRPRRPRPAPSSPADGAGKPAGDHPAFSDVAGWQPLILNHGQACADCGQRLARGQNAVVGIGTSGLLSTYLCLGCLQARG